MIASARWKKGYMDKRTKYKYKYINNNINNNNSKSCTQYNTKHELKW